MCVCVLYIGSIYCEREWIETRARTWGGRACGVVYLPFLCMRCASPSRHIPSEQSHLRAFFSLSLLLLYIRFFFFLHLLHGETGTWYSRERERGRILLCRSHIYTFARDWCKPAAAAPLHTQGDEWGRMHASAEIPFHHRIKTYYRVRERERARTTRSDPLYFQDSSLSLVCLMISNGFSYIIYILFPIPPIIIFAAFLLLIWFYVILVEPTCAAYATHLTTRRSLQLDVISIVVAGVYMPCSFQSLYYLRV